MAKKGKQQGRARIAVAIPTHDYVPAVFMYDLALMTGFTVASLPERAEFGVHMLSGTYIDDARQTLMWVCLEDNATHILWVDSDMRFPKQALIHLLGHNKQVVGINYSKRRFNEGFTAIKELFGPRCETTEKSTGLEEVAALGFGCLLMRVDALAEFPHPKEKPWFLREYQGDGGWLGEDVYFCKMLSERGVKMYVDHDLSKACAHVGTHEYTIDTAQVPVDGDN